MSFTGIMDNKIMSDRSEFELAPILQNLKEHAYEVNREYADLLGINYSKQLTLVRK